MVLKSKFFNIGSSDFDKVWRLVNPKNLSSINKDPALCFVHILRQRNDVGAMIPSELPKSLLTTINKEEIKYDLNSRQSEVKRTSAPAPASTTVTSTPASTVTTTTGPSNLDVSNITTVEQARLLREQFEGLLKYRQALSAAANNPSSAISPGSFNINSITEDLDSIEQQVEGLEAYLSRKKQELASLQQSSHNLKGEGLKFDCGNVTCIFNCACRCTLSLFLFFFPSFPFLLLYIHSKTQKLICQKKTKKEENDNKGNMLMHIYPSHFCSFFSLFFFLVLSI